MTRNYLLVFIVIKLTVTGHPARSSRLRKRYEVQVFQTAIKEYMSSKDKKLSQLIVYADMMGIRDEVMKYVEVLV